MLTPPRKTHFNQMTSAPSNTGVGATIIDLNDPYDLSPAVNHIVTIVQEARAADQKVILLLGEAHSNITHVRLAELVRRGLAGVGIHHPVIAREERHNLAEVLLPLLYQDESHAAFRTAAARALLFLKTNDSPHYRRLQSLCHAAWDWPGTPVTRLENFTAWHANNTTIRMVDMATTQDDYLDRADPETNAFIAANTLKSRSETDTQLARIHDKAPEGVRLRNLWMAQQLQGIESPVEIIQTGVAHLGGWGQEEMPYAHSLHRIFAKAAARGTNAQQTRVIALFPENHGITFNNYLSAAARQAMNNPDTIILRGTKDVRHNQNNWHGSFNKEIAALDLFGGTQITNEADYYNALAQNKAILTKELESVIQQYAAPAPMARHG